MVVQYAKLAISSYNHVEYDGNIIKYWSKKLFGIKKIITFAIVILNTIFLP